MWESIIGGATFLGIGGFVTKHLSGRINRVEDKNSETDSKIFSKLDGLNREMGEVKTEMREGFKRVEQKIDGSKR